MISTMEHFEESASNMIGGSAFNEIKIFSLVLVILLLIDLPMILLINKNMYEKQLNSINGVSSLGEQKDVNKLQKYGSAAICYLLLAFSLYHFAVKQRSLLNAGLLGLVIYGVYNTTNSATITKYNVQTAAIDTVWGSVLFMIVYVMVSLLSFLIISDVSEGEAETVTTTDAN